MQGPGKHTHIELQSLRGLAASVVLIHHCLRSVHATAVTSAIADRLLDTQAAVVFFFVLSGYVLSTSLSRRTLGVSEVIGFYIRRIFRIYPTLFVACLAVVVVLATVPSPSGKLASDWVRSYHAAGLVPRGLLVMSFLSVSMYLHPMLWTMFVEVSASAVMPVIRWAQVRGPGWFVGLAVVLSFLSVFVPSHTKLVSVYLVTFAIGAAVPFLSNAVIWMHRRGRVLESASLVAAVAVLCWSRELIPMAYLQSHDPVLAQLEALAAMWIVALTVHRPCGYPRLRRPALVWLGDISYGLYLLHFPILLVSVSVAEFMLSSQVNRTALALGIAAAVYLGTVLVAALCYAVVELPAVALGARIAQLVRGRPGVHAGAREAS